MNKTELKIFIRGLASESLSMFMDDQNALQESALKNFKSLPEFEKKSAFLSLCSYAANLLLLAADESFAKRMEEAAPSGQKEQSEDAHERYIAVLQTSPRFDDFIEFQSKAARIVNESDFSNVDFDSIAVEFLQILEKTRLEISTLIKKSNQFMPTITSSRPSKHIMPNNRMTNELSAGRIPFSLTDNEFWEFCVSSQKAKNKIFSSVMVSYEGDNVKTIGRRPFTEYDRSVYNAITSLYVQGDPQHIMTPAMIYRAMTAATDSTNPSAQQIGTVTRSIDKMRFTRACIDCTEELNQRGAQIEGEQITEGIIDTYLLNADKIQANAGGKSVAAYRINKPPILYEYSRATSQVLTVPSDLLAIKEADEKGVYNKLVANNDSRIQLKNYLLRRIEGIKGKNNLNNDTISMESYEKGGKHHPGIYEVFGKPSPSTKDATNIRNYVSAVLNFWKAENYIKGYCFVKTGRTITGVRISV